MDIICEEKTNMGGSSTRRRRRSAYMCSKIARWRFHSDGYRTPTQEGESVGQIRRRKIEK